MHGEPLAERRPCPTVAPPARRCSAAFGSFIPGHTALVVLGAAVAGAAAFWYWRRRRQAAARHGGGAGGLEMAQHTKYAPMPSRPPASDDSWGTGQQQQQRQVQRDSSWDQDW